MRVLLIFLVNFWAFIITGQSSENESIIPTKGDFILSTSIGLINPQDFAFNIFGFDGGGHPSPALNIEGDYYVNNAISIGPFATYYRVDAQYEDNLNNILESIGSGNADDIINNLACLIFGNCPKEVVTERTDVLVLGGRLAYHRQIIAGIDMYASSSLGYGFNKRKTITTEVLDLFSNELGLGVQVPSFVYYTSLGIRYFINEKWGIYGELGYGNSHLIKLGINFRIKSK